MESLCPELSSSWRRSPAGPGRQPSSLRSRTFSNRRRRGFGLGIACTVAVALLAFSPSSCSVFMGLLGRFRRVLMRAPLPESDEPGKERPAPEVATLEQVQQEPQGIGRLETAFAAEAVDAAAGDAVDDITLAEFETDERRQLLEQLKDRWIAALKGEIRQIYPEIDSDPFFVVDRMGTLRRFLLASAFDVDDALTRMRATAKWRNEWDVLEYYKPGAAEMLFSEDLNPGAEMYFADSLQVDRQGRPYAAGRLKFANPENMHPWRHLRAGVLVFERMATKVAALKRGPASYILDIGSVGDVSGNVSGTAGLDRNYDEGINPYYSKGAGTEDAPSPAMLEEFGSLDNGFAVLKAAIAILNKYYPGIIGQVYYLNSDMLFWGAFKVFSRWIADRGSIDFQFLGPASWREYPMEQLLDSFPEEQLFREWGGNGPSLEGDAFMERAIRHYEDEAVELQMQATS
eukprot:TRINITY_DN20174_c0_g1_i1.p2 TRINITY_DN20174_c0_g1~~TRINITY_DN20174_c0_g1_i1.p2  ORF type:complete len:459 (-),score=127.76 TRINITY_DN20174_c0_g1_i1:247-1623(-)